MPLHATRNAAIPEAIRIRAIRTYNRVCNGCCSGVKGAIRDMPTLLTTCGKEESLRNSAGHRRKLQIPSSRIRIPKLRQRGHKRLSSSGRKSAPFKQEGEGGL